MRHGRLMVLAVALAVTLAAPGTASAATFTCTHHDVGGVECSSTATRYPSFQGGAGLEYPVRTFNDGLVAGASVQPLQGWRWTGATWASVRIEQAGWYGPLEDPVTPGYHWPYAGGWSWYWEQRLGWVAVPSSAVRLTIPSSYIGYARRTGCTRVADPNGGAPTLIGYSPGWTCEYAI